MNNNIGLNIRNYRKNRGYTQEELAGMLRVTPQAISRWESEAGLPDVSMIVPLAQALHVTTDMLLGYNITSQDNYLAEQLKKQINEMWDISDTGGSALKCTEFLAKEVNNNPMNFEICLMYVEQVAGLSFYIDMEGLLADDPQRAKAILTDGVKKGVNLIRFTNDRKIIDKVNYALAWIYIHTKDFSNAREHINALPSLENNRMKELLTPELSFFENGFEEMKESFVITNKLLCNVLLSQLHSIAENYAYWGEKDEAIRNLKWCENVANAFAEIPEYTNDGINGFWKKFNHNLMTVYERTGNKDKANEICENYLSKIKASGEYSEEEYESIAKEFKERIYQL